MRCVHTRAPHLPSNCSPARHAAWKRCSSNCEQQGASHLHRRRLKFQDFGLEKETHGRAPLAPRAIQGNPATRLSLRMNRRVRHNLRKTRRAGAQPQIKVRHAGRRTRAIRARHRRRQHLRSRPARRQIRHHHRAMAPLATMLAAAGRQVLIRIRPGRHHRHRYKRAEHRQKNRRYPSPHLRKSIQPGPGCNGKNSRPPTASPSKPAASHHASAGPPSRHTSPSSAPAAAATPRRSSASPP